MKVKTLLCPIHDPDARYLEALKEKMGALAALYEHMIFAVSSKTSTKIVDFLGGCGNVTLVPSNGYGFGAMNAFRQAVGFDELYHWIDSDRILHWLSAYPDELSGLLKNPPQKHYTILGRTQRAISTHPESWIHCEFPCNQLFSRRFGTPMDVCVANIFLSRDAVQWILQDSGSESWAILTEWPLTVCRHAGKEGIGYLAIEGNEWEDPDYYAGEIELAGGLEQWKSSRYDSDSEWLKRLQNSVEIITPLVKVSPTDE